MGLYLRYQFLQVADEHRLAVGTAHFPHPGAPVLGGHFPETGKSQRAHGFANADVALAVALSGPGQHGVGAGLNIAVNVAGVMDAQKGKAGVGDGIDQSLYQMVAARGQFVVLAAEGDDANGGVLAHHRRQAVGVEAAAVDDMPGLQRAPFRFQRGSAAGLPRPRHRRAGENVAAGRLKFAGVCVGDAHIVHDAGMRRPQRADAGGVRLNLRQAFRPYDFQIRHAVGDAALVQVLQPAQLAFVGRHDNLAAGVVFNLVRIAEGHQSVFPAHAEPRFPRTGAVINAGMDDAAVMPGLVLSQPFLFLNDGNAQAGRGVQQLHRRGQADDAAADHSHIVGAGCH